MYVRSVFKTVALSQCLKEYMKPMPNPWKKSQVFYCIAIVILMFFVGCVQVRQPLPREDNDNDPGFSPLSHGPLLFSDGFESGNFQNWTFNSGLVAQQQIVAEGAWAAQGTMNGVGAWAYKTLSATTSELTASLRIQMVSIPGTNAVNFLKLRTSSGTAIAEVFITPAGRLGMRNNAAGVTTNSTITITTGSWRTISLRALVAGTQSRLELFLDGTPVAGLQLTTNLGTNPIGRVQVGESLASRTANFVYDAVTVNGAEPSTGPVLFADGFESGNLQAWTSGSGLVIQQQQVIAGAWAARGVMSGAGAFAYKTLSTPINELTISLDVRINSISGTSAVNFIKLRTSAGAAIAEVYLSPSGFLGVRNNLSGATHTTTSKPTLGVWHSVSLRGLIAGSSSRLDLSLNGAVLIQLSTNLGSNLIGRVQVGESVSGRIGDFVYDAVKITGPLLPPSDPVLVAAGDIACDPLSPTFNGGLGSSTSCRQKIVSDLIVNDPQVSTVAVLGDIQYYCGGAAAFAASYNLSWGRFRTFTRPAVGNHEYIPSSSTTPATDCDPTGQAAGYFGYFGALAGAPSQGYYSYNLGTWHIIVLNSNCPQAGGCSPGTPQDVWLQADLAANPVACTLAYWHIPLWSSGGRAAQNTRTLTQRLYNANVDVVLAGHDHIYERFAPQDPNGVLDTTRGIRAFVVGTGGSNHTTIPGVAANSEVRNGDTFGVLRLTLHPGSYDWRFVPEPGKTFTDTGTDSCH
jgi:acid phosphatase type 7